MGSPWKGRAQIIFAKNVSVISPFFSVSAFSSGFCSGLLGQRVVHDALHVEQWSGLAGPYLKLACALLDKHL